MNKNSIMTIIKGSSLAIVITVVFLIILSFVLAYTNIKESFATPIIMGIIVVSIIIGSIISSRKVKKKGLVNGGIVGFIYIIVIYLLSSIIVRDFSLNGYSLIALIMSVISGIIGGVIGVNL